VIEWIMRQLDGFDARRLQQVTPVEDESDQDRIPKPDEIESLIYPFW
jgi:hypothetical protein